MMTYLLIMFDLNKWIFRHIKSQTREPTLTIQVLLHWILIFSYIWVCVTKCYQKNHRKQYNQRQLKTIKWHSKRAHITIVLLVIPYIINGGICCKCHSFRSMKDIGKNNFHLNKLLQQFSFSYVDKHSILRIG